MQQVLYQFLLDVNLTTTEGCSSTRHLSSATQDCSLPDLNVPHLRPFFKPIYTLVLTIVLYAILILIGVAGNQAKWNYQLLSTICFDTLICLKFQHAPFNSDFRQFNSLPCDHSKKASSRK